MRAAEEFAAEEFDDEAKLRIAWTTKLFSAYGPQPDRIRIMTYVEALARFTADEVRDAVNGSIAVGGEFPESAGDLAKRAGSLRTKRNEAAVLALPASEKPPAESDDDRAEWKRLAIEYRESRGLAVPDWLRDADISRMRVVPDPPAAYVPPLRECPYARAQREVEPDDLAGGYQADPGIGLRCKRLLEARQDAYEAAGVDRIAASWAALNDLSHDTQVGEHVRRIRAAQVRAARGNSAC